MSNIFTTSTRQGLLWCKLRKYGYTIEEIRINGTLQIRLSTPSGRTWLSGAKTSYPMNSHQVHVVADDKRLSYMLAQMLGIHVAATSYIDQGQPETRQIIREILNSCGQVIVKPSDSYKSRGVSLNLETMSAVEIALDIAYKESPVSIVQEQVEAEEYRFTVLSGSVVSVLRRERPQLIGDGVSTLRELVKKENEMRKSLGNSQISYPAWTEELIGSAFESQEILAKDEIRLLSGTTLVSRGASVYELLDETKDEYKRIAERFTKEIAAGFVVIDMFMTDHTEMAPYWFNECNTSPSLKMYYAARNQDNSHIIDKVAELMHQHLNINEKNAII